MALLFSHGFLNLWANNEAEFQKMKREPRVALVIGNSAYSHLPPLRNPKNDATDITNRLRQSGFTVVSALDATREDMEEAVYEFSNRLKKGGIALFYFSGHGLQVKGENHK